MPSLNFALGFPAEAFVAEDHSFAVFDFPLADGSSRIGLKLDERSLMSAVQRMTEVSVAISAAAFRTRGHITTEAAAIVETSAHVPVGEAQTIVLMRTDNGLSQFFALSPMHAEELGRQLSAAAASARLNATKTLQ